MYNALMNADPSFYNGIKHVKERAAEMPST
jgi:hypothetical protein